MKKLFIVVVIVLLISCDDESKLSIANGHWHLELYEDSTLNTLIQEIPLDISSDTVVNYLHRNKIVNTSLIDEDLNILYHVNGHSVEPLQFIRKSGQSFIFKSIPDGGLSKLSPRTNHLQHKLDDYYLDKRLSVDLLRDTCREKFLFSNYDLEIKIGRNLIDEGPEYIMTIEDNLIDYLDVNQMSNYLDKKKMTIVKRKRHLITPVFYMDKDAPLACLSDIQSYYFKMGFSQFKMIFLDANGEDFSLCHSGFKIAASEIATERISNVNHLIGEIVNNEIQTTFSRSLSNEFNNLDQFNLGSYLMYFPDTQMGIGRFDKVIVYNDVEYSDWNLDDENQKFVQLDLLTSGIRLWNGMRVGDSISTHLKLIEFQNGPASDTISYSDTKYQYSLTIDAGEIARIVVTELDFLRKF